MSEPHPPSEDLVTVGEAVAFFHWHRFMRPLYRTCSNRFAHGYHLAFWRWGYR